jgi:hypothetical protein
MESWRKVWRDGLAPLLSTPALHALRRALADDDPRLVQGVTTSPPPIVSLAGWPVEAACATAYCGWQGDGLQTVGEVEEFFASMCFMMDQRLDEPAGCRWFLNWFDETPRDIMRRALLPEVALSLASREDTPCVIDATSAVP